jgi:hypothetical protein
MKLQDHITISKLISFYLKETGDHDNESIHNLLIANAIAGAKKDLNIY